MAKTIQWGNRISGVLFWSIISAAFIGPGTVTTASKAGAAFGTSLLWALLFSTLATIILQEAAARITIATGMNLGEIIVVKYHKAKSLRIPLILFLGIFVGCAAYEAGNILGAVAGVGLISTWPAAWFIVSISILAAILLWFGTYRVIAHAMGIVVALMGIVFLIAAFTVEISFSEIMVSMAVPSFPQGSGLLIISLIGTTIVPYNIFLASGISEGQNVREMRFGIIIAVLIGGIISMAILIVGTKISGEFSFAKIGESLQESFGEFGQILFAIGLFAAGLTSSITAPLAAAITGKSLLSSGNDPTWDIRSNKFRSIWIIVVAFGLIFGLTGVKPIPAIILAQAANGVLLPLFTTFLFLVMNDADLLPSEFRNKYIVNWLMLFIVGVTTLLGLNNMLKAINTILPSTYIQEYGYIMAMIGAILLILILIVKWKGNRRNIG